MTIELTAVFIALVFAVVRLAAQWMSRRQAQQGKTTRGAVVAVCAALLLAALFTVWVASTHYLELSWSVW